MQPASLRLAKKITIIEHWTINQGTSSLFQRNPAQSVTEVLENSRFAAKKLVTYGAPLVGNFESASHEASLFSLSHALRRGRYYLDHSLKAESVQLLHSIIARRPRRSEATTLDHSQKADICACHPCINSYSKACSKAECTDSHSPFTGNSSESKNSLSSTHQNRPALHHWSTGTAEVTSWQSQP